MSFIQNVRESFIALERMLSSGANIEKNLIEITLNDVFDSVVLWGNDMVYGPIEDIRGNVVAPEINRYEADFVYHAMDVAYHQSHNLEQKRYSRRLMAEFMRRLIRTTLTALEAGNNESQEHVKLLLFTNTLLTELTDGE